MTLPDYVNCDNKKLYVCEYYMTSECKETCAFARDIKGLGIGAMTVPPSKLESEVQNDK